MSNLQIIEELCGICADLANIIALQRNTLAQLDAAAAEDEIAKARSRYTALLGAGEWPDNIPDTDEQQEEQET